jgi:hypothetical protein
MSRSLSHSFVPHAAGPSAPPTHPRFPIPVSGSAAPEPCGVPSFDPLRVRGSRDRLRRALLRRRRAVAAALAVTAATLAATGAGDAAGASDADARVRAAASTVGGAAPPGRDPAVMVSAPVRIADASAVRLLRRGDRVDVIASSASSASSTTLPSHADAGEGQDARIVAPGARVVSIPRESQSASDAGALIVLSVPRATATALAGASATSQLAVAWC